MLDRLFKDIGKQIKNWAKASYVIGIIISLLAGFIFFASNQKESITWVGFLITLGGPSITSAFSTLLYGFGELIDKTCDNESNTRLILEKLTPPKTIKTVIDPIIPARTDKRSKKTVGEGEYVSGRTYTKGDSVIFEDKKYICVGSSTVWSPGVAPSQWQEVGSDEVR